MGLSGHLPRRQPVKREKGQEEGDGRRGESGTKVGNGALDGKGEADGRGPSRPAVERAAGGRRREERRAQGAPLTYGRYHGAHEVEGAREVPARAQRVGSDTSGQRGLVVPEEGAQLRLGHAVRRAEVAQRGAPARPRLRLARAFERREDCGARHQVEADERRQQHEATRVLVEVRTAAAAAAAGGARQAAAAAAGRGPGAAGGHGPELSPGAGAALGARAATSPPREQKREDGGQGSGAAAEPLAVSSRTRTAGRLRLLVGAQAAHGSRGPSGARAGALLSAPRRLAGSRGSSPAALGHRGLKLGPCRPVAGVRGAPGLILLSRQAAGCGQGGL